jgi:hypothetical protein
MTLKTRTELAAGQAVVFAPNTTGDISPTDLSTELGHINDSFLPAGITAANASEIATVLEQLSSTGRETLLTALLPTDAADCLTLLSTLATRLDVTFAVIAPIDPEDPDPPPVLAAGQLLETVAEMATGVWSVKPTVPDEFDTDPNTVFVTDDLGEPAAVEMAESQILGRLTGEDIKGLSVAELKTLLSDVTALVTAATTSAAGKVELATSAEINTGTDTGRAIGVDEFAGSNFATAIVQFDVFNPTTEVTTGDGKMYFHVPVELNGMNLVGVAARVITAGTTGTTDIQIRNVTDAVDILSTKMTIDSTETDTATAATPAVINASNDDVATSDLLAIDIDATATTKAQGLLVTLKFRLP